MNDDSADLVYGAVLGALVGLVLSLVAVTIVVPPPSKWKKPKAIVFCPETSPIDVEGYEIKDGRIAFVMGGVKVIAPMTCGLMEVKEE